VSFELVGEFLDVRNQVDCDLTIVSRVDRRLGLIKNLGVTHAYVMEHSKNKLAFLAKVDQDYFKGGCGASMLNIEFSSVYNLITLVSLDVTFMR
jgi:hypothetical protein